jgi:hypothetical protein
MYLTGEQELRARLSFYNAPAVKERHPWWLVELSLALVRLSLIKTVCAYSCCVTQNIRNQRSSGVMTWLAEDRLIKIRIVLHKVKRHLSQPSALSGLLSRSQIRA